MTGIPAPTPGSYSWRTTPGSTTPPTVLAVAASARYEIVFGQSLQIFLCQEVFVTAPNVYWSSPGVLRHDYPQSEAPVIPQIEDWKWMWISEDNQWSVVVWCGSNPMLDYNGAFMLSRSRSDGSIPADLEPTIR